MMKDKKKIIKEKVGGVLNKRTKKILREKNATIRGISNQEPK